MMRRRARRASGAMTMTELRQKEKEAAVAVEAKEKRVGGDVRTSATATETATVESNNAASTKDAAADCLPIVYQSTIAADVDNAVVGPGPGVEQTPRQSKSSCAAAKTVSAHVETEV